MKAVEALKKLPEGETLEVLTDHMPALSNIPLAVVPMGYRVRIEQRGSSEWSIFIHREEATEA